jgi:hypothetical protein
MRGDHMSDQKTTENDKLLKDLHELIRNWENEVVEFKQASNSFSQHEIG